MAVSVQSKQALLDETRSSISSQDSSTSAPIWENALFAQRFENLVQFTNRPSLVRQLMDINEDVNDKILRRHIRQVEERFGIERIGVRGKQALFSTTMRKPLERYHASILFALMRLVGLEESVHFGSYTDHVVEIYQRYLLVTGSRNGNAPISFEEMMEIRSAIISSQVIAIDCGKCGAQHISHSPDSSCPFCVLHEHEAFNLAGQINEFQGSVSMLKRRG
jgi:hypothetical protein